MQMKTIQKLIFSVEMKNKLLTSLLLVFSIFGNNAIGQTIDEIIIPGATSSNNGTTWDVEFFSSTNTTTNAQNFKEIKVVQTALRGSIWFGMRQIKRIGKL
jgi:gamma-glutamyl-gamma-aminobutyrate hydrolase PuuD